MANLPRGKRQLNCPKRPYNFSYSGDSIKHYSVWIQLHKMLLPVKLGSAQPGLSKHLPVGFDEQTVTVDSGRLRVFF